MNKIKFLFSLLIFTLFISNVNALEYNIGTSVKNTSSNDKNLYEILVSLKDITDTGYGIGSCTLNIDLSDDIEFNGSVRTFGGWSMISHDVYLFDTGTPALKNTDFMIIPVKVNGSGSITIRNISCSDGEVDKEVADAVINLKYIDSSDNNQNNNQNNTQNNNQNNNQNNTQGDVQDDDNSTGNSQLDSNCNLSNIVLSEGTIDFDPNVTEYEIEVSSVDDLIVEPELVSDKATYNIIKTVKKVTIEVVALDGTSKQYILHIKENDDTSLEDNNKYVPIFIGIICILVLINIFRIIKNNKKKVN